MALQAVDLFCGAGGLSLGLREAGIRPVFAADFDSHSCATYRANLGDHVRQLDLSQTSVSEFISMVRDSTERVDIVAGGPPCQGFSVQRRGQPLDARNELVKRFGQYALALSPKAILMENVPTILGARGRAFIDFITEAWEQEYVLHKAILDAVSYGVPQFRRRAFVVAIRKDLNAQFSFPEPTRLPEQYVTVREAIADLPSPQEDFNEHPDHHNHRRVAISARNLERISYVPEGGGRLDVPSKLQLPCHKASNGHRHLDVFGRLWWDRPAGTITAMFDNFTRGRFAHPEENRNITSREGARLQSFPDSFRFLGPKKDVAKQIGNAVPPRLGQAVGEALVQALSDERPTSKETAQCTSSLLQEKFVGNRDYDDRRAF
ncbi:DNA cytosine methyltransferase [Paenirhodobacter populi]|uniref:Cytosine-specific methyltransferase n=1 Tax=Paenirhodobacter populi TaxID=2306993 RepID=A0A443JVC8_9RHOB|nr:DNA cytosine methyltransferase [Sinirhodobacter populi]RWR24458.1 DNA cytosine methyltransferase [Sinirhodobacter populi]